MINNCFVKLCFFDVLIDLCLLIMVLGGKNYIVFYYFIFGCVCYYKGYCGDNCWVNEWLFGFFVFII